LRVHYSVLDDNVHPVSGEEVKRHTIAGQNRKRFADIDHFEPWFFEQFSKCEKLEKFIGKNAGPSVGPALPRSFKKEYTRANPVVLPPHGPPVKTNL